MDKPNVRAFRTYLYVAGALLTVFVVAVQLNPGLLGLEREMDWWAFLLLTVFGVVTRFLSIEAPVRQITIILDTPVFLTAILTLGTVQGGLVVYTTMMTYDLWRVIRRTLRQGDERRPLPDLVGVMFYSSAMTTSVMLVLGTVYGVDANPGGYGQAPDYGMIPVIGVSFLVIQYLLAVVPYLLKGIPWKRIFRGVLLPGLFVEVILLQLAVLAVITYERQDLTPFLLLSATYVFVNFVIRRLSQTSAAQARQVRELEALNRLGQTACTTLDTAEFIARFAQETLDLISPAGVFVLSYAPNPDESSALLEVHGRGGTIPDHFDQVEALSVAAETQGPATNTVQSTPTGCWISTPLTVKDERVGCLALWSAEAESFDDRDLHSLARLGHQATFALENARLYGLATVDSLTGLYLRRYFEERLSEEFARVDRYAGSCSVILLDVDWLKAINDQQGHAAGDAALIHVAQVIREQTRLLDVPARLGGDEFAILLPSVDANLARSVAERIRGHIAKTPIAANGSPFNVTVCMGVACHPEHQAESADALVALADRALYRSKQDPKRNQVQIFDPET